MAGRAWFFTISDATMRSRYAENPEMALYAARCSRLLNDPSNIIGSLFLPVLRATGIGWTLHRQGRGWLDSDWYREIEAPLDSCWWLDAMIGDAGQTIAAVNLTRPRSAHPFAVDDVQRLDRLRPWLAHAFRRSNSHIARQEDEASIDAAGAPVRSGQMILTADAKARLSVHWPQTAAQNSCRRARHLHALRASQRQAARACFESSSADYWRRERSVKHAAPNAAFDCLWCSHARSEMARASGHTPGRRRQGPKTLSHRGDDRTPRTCNCPCGSRAAGKRRHAGADENRHSARVW